MSHVTYPTLQGAAELRMSQPLKKPGYELARVMATLNALHAAPSPPN